MQYEYLFSFLVPLVFFFSSVRSFPPPMYFHVLQYSSTFFFIFRFLDHVEYTIYIRQGKKLLSSSWKEPIILVSFITWLFHPLNPPRVLSIYYSLEVLCIWPSKVTQGWWFSRQKAKGPLFLWRAETLVTRVFSSLHRITQITTNGNMGKSTGGEQRRGQEIEWL